MKLLFLIVTAGVKLFLCKGIVLGIILLLFWVKGRQLRFDADKWEMLFQSLPAEKVEKYAAGIYLIAAGLSSGIAFLILEFCGYRHSLGIAMVLFVGGFIMTARKWHREGKDYFRERYQQISTTVKKEIDTD